MFEILFQVLLLKTVVLEFTYAFKKMLSNLKYLLNLNIIPKQFDSFSDILAIVLCLELSYTIKMQKFLMSLWYVHSMILNCPK